MADLPSDRLESVPPFSNSGVDVFGPFLVHDGKTTRRTNASKKIWVLICVCLVSRAIHLEPLNCLDTNSVQLALRRFQSLRGSCKLIRSDNGTNFLGAMNQNQQESHTDSIREGVLSLGCVWKTTPPYASHFAGVWERKVAEVKKAIYSTLICNYPRPLPGTTSGGPFLSREEFSTLLQEAATIVNSTPYGEISEDPNEPIPLSPQHLLTLRDSVTPDLEKVSDDDLSSYGKLR